MNKYVHIIHIMMLRRPKMPVWHATHVGTTNNMVVKKDNWRMLKCWGDRLVICKQKMLISCIILDKKKINTTCIFYEKSNLFKWILLAKAVIYWHLKPFKVLQIQWIFKYMNTIFNPQHSYIKVLPSSLNLKGHYNLLFYSVFIIRTWRMS